MLFPAAILGTAAEGLPVIHHGRQPDGTILKSIVTEGTLTLSPPGIELDVVELLAARQ